MKLGIFVNTDRHAEDLEGIAKAAIAKGHSVILFFMDDGVNLLTSPAVNELAGYPEVAISYCEYTIQMAGLSTDGIHENIDCGSQFDNAMMNNKADRVIVL